MCRRWAFVGSLWETLYDCDTDACVGVCAFSIGFLVNTTPFLFGAVTLLWGIAIVVDSGQFSTAVTELSEPHLVGTALTFQMALGFGITVITIWLVPVAAR